MKVYLLFKDSQAKQRKASLVKAVEKAKEGRQDTVGIFSKYEKKQHMS